MSAKLTPGEWSVSEYPFEKGDGETAYAKLEIVAPSQDGRFLNFCVGRVDFSPNHQGFMPCDLEEAEANARLFAASKKMLEALRKSLDFLEFAWRDVSMNEYAEAKRAEVKGAVCAAIAAATGEQQ